MNNFDDKFTKSAKLAFSTALKIMKNFNVEYVGTESILAGLLSTNCVAKEVLENHGLSHVRFTAILRDNINYTRKKGGFTAPANALIAQAIELMHKLDCSFIATEHILFCMLEQKDCLAYALIKENIIDFDALYSDVKEKVRVISSPSLFNAYFGIKSAQTPQYPKKIVENVHTDENLKPDISINIPVENNIKSESQSVNSYKSQLEGENPLSQFGEDLTQKALLGKVDPVIGRDNEITQVVQALSRRLKNSPLLIGEPGIGKSAIVEGLAQKIVSGDVPSVIQGKTVFSLDMTGLIAGAKYHGEFEERFKKAIEFIKSNSNIILFIDEIHTIMGAGNSIGVSQMLKPMLARGELQLIGATTIEEYRKYIEKDAALSRRFQVITLEPPSQSDCIEMIKGLRSKFEAYYKIDVTDEAIEAAVRLSERFITDRFLPDKAIDLIDEALAHAKVVLATPLEEEKNKENELRKLEAERQYSLRLGKSVSALDEKIKKITKDIEEISDRKLRKVSKNTPFIDSEDIAKVISLQTSIPISKLTESESEKLLHLEEHLHKRVIGQTEAVTAISKAVRRARAYVKDEKRPIGSFIFVGPTGVGKTELSKALAEMVFGDDKMLIRLDMSEYMEQSSVAKLIGAPPGYVGYDEEGQLTEKVRRKPYSVVLFDEIEKAHPEIFNIMLQILDDGRLTDSKGRLVDFKNTIIIITSNEGAQQAQQTNSFGFGGDNKEVVVKDKILQALKKKFKPEFLNRIDDIIVFTSLSKQECGEICDLLCEGLIERLKVQNINLVVSDDCKELILEKGYDAEFGARPLRRTIQKLIEDAISEEIISGKITSGDFVTAIRNGDEVKFIK